MKGVLKIKKCILDNLCFQITKIINIKLIEKIKTPTEISSGEKNNVTKLAIQTSKSLCSSLRILNQAIKKTSVAKYMILVPGLKKIRENESIEQSNNPMNPIAKKKLIAKVNRMYALKVPANVPPPIKAGK